MKKHRILLFSHCATLFLCLFILLFVPANWHLRWNLGYLIAYATLITGFACTVVALHRRHFSLIVRIYLAVFSLAALLFIAYPITRDLLVPPPCYGGDKGYMVRKEPSVFIDPEEIVLYKAHGLTEEPVRTLTRGFGIDDISDIEVRQDLSAIIMTVVNTGEEFKSREKGIYAINTAEFHLHRARIERLARQRHLTIMD